jgi:dipeptidyl aminopeptidase/acylaminoacyl peptidase
MKYSPRTFMNVFRLAFATLLIYLVVPEAQAQQAPGTALPIESFFKQGQFVAAALNPSATHVAYIREVNGRYSLLTMDVGTRKLTAVADSPTADIVEFDWINNKRLIYRIEDVKVGVGDNQVFGWYAIDADGGKPYTLNEGLVSTGASGSSNRGMPARSTFRSRVQSGDKDDYIAVQYAESPFRTTLMRINSRNGLRKPIETDGLTNVIDWALDSEDVPRAAVTRENENYSVYVRQNATKSWKQIKVSNVFDGPGLTPLRFDKAGNLYVTASVSRDTSAIYRFDWLTDRPEPLPLASVKNYDIGGDLLGDNQFGGVIFDEDGSLAGVRYEADQASTYWFSETWKGHQDAIDSGLPGKVNLLSGDVKGTILVRSYSDTSPPRFFLYDSVLKKLSLLGAARPWIDEKTQARSDVIRYVSRDGMEIPALLTLPRGVDPKGLPLVLLVHGGPNVRGVHWGWNRERQFLASRGYAVLEPDFRGSMGHGWKLFRAGWRQWGLSMQEDLADGVSELSKRGIINKDRVCIAGASYGGYATVMGLIKDPDIYKCGISWVGVTDIDLLFTVGWSDLANNPEQRLGMKVLIADREKDKAQIRETSAINQASRLKAPLILAYGLSDVRVPYDHGQKLRDALKPHNKNVEYIEYSGEGHGWRLLKTNLDFWSKVGVFLEKNIGK